MRENQKILTFNFNGVKGEVEVPSEVDRSTLKIYKLAYFDEEPTLPIKIKHGQTIFILNEGHDFKIINNVIITSNPDIAKGKLLIEWGKEVKLTCPHCKNELYNESQNFCGECGTKLY